MPDLELNETDVRTARSWAVIYGIAIIMVITASALFFVQAYQSSQAQENRERPHDRSAPATGLQIE